MKRNLEEISHYVNVNNYIDNYELNSAKNETENIQILSTEISELLNKNNIIDHIYLKLDTQAREPELISWKIIALYKALETTKVVKRLDLYFATEDIAVSCAFSQMLQLNTSIKSLSLLTQLEDKNEEDRTKTQLIANGLIYNHHIKMFEFSNDCGAEKVNKIIVDAVKINSNIKHFIGYDELNCYSSLIKANKIVTLESLIPHQKAQGESLLSNNSNPLLQSALIKNTNLLHLFDNNNLIRKHDLYSHSVDNNVPDDENYTYFKNILQKNKTLEFVPSYWDKKYENIDHLHSLINRNKENTSKIINSITTINFDLKTVPTIEHIVTLRKYEKLGKNLVEEKLKIVDWTNNNLIREYAKVYEINELEQYNINKDFTKFTQEQRFEWQSLFERHVSIFDDEQEVSANKLIQKISDYKSSYFFHLNLIAKDVSFGPDTMKPIKHKVLNEIASYLKFEDIIFTDYHDGAMTNTIAVEEIGMGSGHDKFTDS